MGSEDQTGADISGTLLTNPYATQLAASDAEVLTIEFTGTPEWTDELEPEDGSLDTFNSIQGITRVRGYDGSILDQSGTFMLILSPDGDPSDLVIDTDENGIIDDATVDPTAPHLNWTIYDSVSIIDGDDFDEVGEFAYGQIIFAEPPAAADNPQLFFDSSISTLVVLDQDPQYVARLLGSTGYVGGDDWIAGRLDSNSFPEWEFNGNEGQNIPSSLANTTIPLITYGDPNNSVLLSVEDNTIINQSVAVFTNNNALNIQVTDDTIVTQATLYGMTGKQLYTSKTNVSNIDLSSFSKGMYIARLETNKGSDAIVFAVN